MKNAVKFWFLQKKICFKNTQQPGFGLPAGHAQDPLASAHELFWRKIAALSYVTSVSKKCSKIWSENEVKIALMMFTSA
jgi:hypothetical protein